MRLPAFEDLSKEQDAIYNLDLDGNYLVSGPPGTGKSVMALYRAQALSFDDREPAVLMYNNVLQQYTEQAATEIGVGGFVTTFHKWMGRFWQQTYRRRAPTLTGDPYAHDWQEVASTFLSRPPAADSLSDLIVDEGQDLAIGFYRIVRYLAKNITVFADENQKLEDNNTTLSEIQSAIKAAEHHVLRRNYRNSAEIAAVAAAYYSGTPTGIPKPPARSGARPTLRNFGQLNDLVDHIAMYVRARSHLSVGIVCPTTGLQKKLINRLTARNLPVPVQAYISKEEEHRRLNFDAPAVTLVHYKSVKGLEFDTLFVPELQLVTADPTSASTRMMFYVVMSRARDELHLSWGGDGGMPAIVEGLKLLTDVP